MSFGQSNGALRVTLIGSLTTAVDVSSEDKTG
jgi:hypothetical protein